MTDHNAEISAELPCHLCGYDLRAHPQDGKCPECGASVAESRRVAAIPRRPAWRDSDPRWRRRMVAGAWILVLLPLMDALTAFDWASSVPVPTVFDFRGTVRSLDHTLASYPGVYPPLAFCVGVVLLFSKERGRRRGRLDWTRRWGVLCSYVVLLLSAAGVLFISALVLSGIAALFQSMPLKYQPDVTPTFVRMSSGYLLYGPHPMQAASAALVVFSSVTIVLACVRLFDALRSSGPRRLAVVIVAPLALFALMHLAQTGRYLLNLPGATEADIFPFGLYFWPQLLVNHMAGLTTYRGWNVPESSLSAFVVEAAKWSIVLTIAVWLTIAQLAAWWHGKTAKRHKSGEPGPKVKR